jgi:cathepsin B
MLLYNMVFRRFIKVALIGLAIVGTAVASFVAPPEMVAEVNNHPSATWKAENSKWSQMPIEQAKALMGTEINYANVFATDFQNARLTVSGVNSGLECTVCEYALGWVEKEIAGNYTESKIEGALEKVCGLLPKSYTSMCDTLIESYTPELINFILEKESPDVICKLLKVCETTSVIKNSIECDLCDFAVGWVENKLPINATAQEVETLLTEVCNIVPKEYQAGCQAIVQQYGTDLINMLLKEISPHAICKMIGLCTSEMSALPTNFDGRQAFGKCVHPVRDQQQCGSCWAFSASEVLSDRFCIASKGATDVILSPQTLVSCDTSNMGCQGGYLDKAWEFMVSNGIASDQCEPYISGSGDSGTCPTKCADGSQIKYYKAANYKHVTGVTNIQTELMTNGPVQVAFEVYQDFMAYKSGVYHHITSSSLLGGHAVVFVGWGVENGTAYWLVKNSWGPSWGEQGYFRIVRGKNECGIESNVYTGKASL